MWSVQRGFRYFLVSLAVMQYLPLSRFFEYTFSFFVCILFTHSVLYACFYNSCPIVGWLRFHNNLPIMYKFSLTCVFLLLPASPWSKKLSQLSFLSWPTVLIVVPTMLFFRSQSLHCLRISCHTVSSEFKFSLSNLPWHTLSSDSKSSFSHFTCPTVSSETNS